MANSKAEPKFTFRVTRSFGAFNEGEEFESERDEFVTAFERAGLLKEVASGEGEDQARQG